MRRSSIGILALVLVAAAQRPSGGILPSGLRWGPPTLSNPNPFSRPNRGFAPQFGTTPFRPWADATSWRRPGLFPNPLILGWNSWLPFDAFGLYETPDPGYPIGPYLPDNYVQPSSVPVAPSAPPEPPGPMGRETLPEAAESSTPDTPEMPVHRGPASPPSGSDEHPTLIALRNRWAYTVLKYWVKGKTFNFITTQGDHMQVRTNLVERIYPTAARPPNTEPYREPTH